MADHDLDKRVKQYLARHKGAGRGIRLMDLIHLSDAPARKGRDIDRALQRLRKRGEITFDRVQGWKVVPPEALGRAVR
jgi:hypothetical protein